MSYLVAKIDDLKEGVIVYRTLDRTGKKKKEIIDSIDISGMTLSKDGTTRSFKIKFKGNDKEYKCWVYVEDNVVTIFTDFGDEYELEILQKGGGRRNRSLRKKRRKNRRGSSRRK